MAAKFTMSKRHYVALSREMLTSDWMRALMLRKAQAGADFARSIAPRDTDHWADSFSASTAVVPSPRGDHGLMVVGRVTSDDPAGMHIELGTAHTPKHRTLGRSLGAMRDG
jgi:hypothetical protein